MRRVFVVRPRTGTRTRYDIALAGQTIHVARGQNRELAHFKALGNGSETPEAQTIIARPMRPTLGTGVVYHVSVDRPKYFGRKTRSVNGQHRIHTASVQLHVVNSAGPGG